MSATSDDGVAAAFPCAARDCLRQPSRRVVVELSRMFPDDLAYETLLLCATHASVLGMRSVGDALGAVGVEIVEDRPLLAEAAGGPP